MKEWSTVARILRARGNRGEVAAEQLCRSFERLKGLRVAVLFAEDRWPEGMPVEVEAVWEHRGLAIFKFRGVDSIEEAERLRGAEVRTPLEERPDPVEGEYYLSDLIGCEVVERSSGERLGTVEGIREYGAAPLLEVTGPDGEILIPLARSICVTIDVAAKRMEVDLPDGLKELNR
jgi:16S rRNA processing protein RimM